MPKNMERLVPRTCPEVDNLKKKEEDNVAKLLHVQLLHAEST